MSMYGQVIGEEPVVVKTRQVFPLANEANAAVNQINQWMNRPFSLNVWRNGSAVNRAVLPRERMPWMLTSEEPRGLVAGLNLEGVRRYLKEVNLALGSDAEIRLDEAAGQVAAALQRGDDSVWLVAPRAQVRHTIESGDTFDALSDRYGIPAPRLIAANPGAQANGLAVGKELVIPDQNSMLPAAIAPDNLKHVEVDLTAQALYAYDGPQRVLSATISSGIPQWRTLTGVFQVLAREDEACNELAHVRMPNWLTLYDLTDTSAGAASNGIHALPILQSGKRLWAGYLGKPVSFGCIVMSVTDSEFLYPWADLGTPVVIYGGTPPSSLHYDNLVEAQQKAR
jgi:lipoprotein-anchoring transpeptidase ErfK/SrfK